MGMWCCQPFDVSDQLAEKHWQARIIANILEYKFEEEGYPKTEVSISIKADSMNDGQDMEVTVTPYGHGYYKVTKAKAS